MRKAACVTGADRGVGLELVRGLLQKDYFVFAGRNLLDWELLPELAREWNEQLLILEMDISSDESVRKACEEMKSKTSSLELLINNGAILGDIAASVFDPIDFDQINHVFNINAVGALRMTNALLPLILQSEKKLVVNISSEAGSIAHNGRTGWFAYCMSKAALNMETSIVHHSIYPKGGQAISIHPGHVKSYMQGKLDTAGVLTPAESANYILELLEKHRDYIAEEPVYIDYLGNRMEW